MLHAVYRVLLETVNGFIDDKATRLGAALGFYTALSIAPLLVIAVGIAGQVYGPEAARGEIAHQLQNLIGAENASTVEKLIAGSRSTRDGILASIFGLATLLYAATGIFAELRDAINTIWNIPSHEEPTGVWNFVRTRLLAFLLVCFLAFLLLVSLVASTFLNAFGDWINAKLPEMKWTLTLWNQGLSFVFAWMLFAMVFKLLPVIRRPWEHILVGAFFTAVLFAVGKYALGIYMGRMAVGSAFGAAGSFVALLLWLYYSSLIVLFGAEFTQAYANARRRGQTQTPTMDGENRSPS